MRSSLPCLVLGLFVACNSGAPDPSWTGTGTSWPEADRLFRQDPRWLGGDGAYSCALGNGRVAWLFGDSFVANTVGETRTTAKLVRNSVAVQAGPNPVAANMTFAWATDGQAAPSAYFPNDGDRWYWPGACLRLPAGPLAIFLMRQKPATGGLGFTEDGWRLALIENPDDPPTTWRVAYHDPAVSLFVANVGVAATMDDTHAYLLATSHGSEHRGHVARIALGDLVEGKLPALEWWAQGTWLTLDHVADQPTNVMDDAGSEASWHVVSDTWFHFASQGFGATTIALRTAPAAIGPWSKPVDVFTPPESQGPNPFVYAGKAHPELETGEGTLAITYATNSFTFADLFTPTGMDTLYWPRFARLTLSKR